MTVESLSQIVRREIAPWIELSETQLALLEQHYGLLVAWNRRMNLTTVTDLPEAATRHYCESLFLSKYVVAECAGLRIADIGSGAGFPGIPLAVALPEAQVELVESHQRKSVFLKESTRGLRNVVVRPVRAEALEGSYDWVVSRAVRFQDVLALRIGHRFGLLVGEEDLEALGGMASRGEIRSLSSVAIPWGQRRFVALVSRGTTA